MEITFERDRTIIYGSRYPRVVLWCDSCSSQVEMITVFDAARLAEVSSYTIHTWAETGKVHGQTSAAGLLLICLNSLAE